MSDIRSTKYFMAGRYKWTEFGHERHLQRGCAFGDIDAALESNGRHLFIECKYWGDNDNPLPNPGGPPPLGIPKGQWMSLYRLAHKQDCDVWLLYGDAEQNNPTYLVEVGIDEHPHRVYPLANLSLEQRREWFSRRVGLWQAEADGRPFKPDQKSGDERVVTRQILEAVFQ